MYFDTPTPSTTLAGISEWFNPIFANFYVFGLAAIGIILAFGIIAWIINIFKGAIK